MFSLSSTSLFITKIWPINCYHIIRLSILEKNRDIAGQIKVQVELVFNDHASSFIKLFKSFILVEQLVNFMFKTVQEFSNFKAIRQTLVQLSQEKLSSFEILTLIRKFMDISSQDQINQSSDRKVAFSALEKLYSAQLPGIYKKVAKFVLQHPSPSIPLFYSNEQKIHTFKKSQILYLYCQMMLCLIPKQPYFINEVKKSRFNYLLDFSYIFEQEEYKTQAVIEFIKKTIDDKDSYNETMTIHRHIQHESIQKIIEDKKYLPMSKIIWAEDNASIQDYYGDLKIDFANKYIGGGALMSGCVQQELMFSNHPELFTSQLLCEIMNPNESIFLSGYKKYFRNDGYGWTASYAGPENHQYKYVGSQAVQYISAIDAIPFHKYSDKIQFTMQTINRELLKAYCGFNFPNPDVKRIATGNWGCGAFGGNLQLKFLIQWIAASLVGRELIYCPFGSKSVIYNENLITLLAKMNIGQTYDLLNRTSKIYQSKNNEEKSVYETLELLI